MHAATRRKAETKANFELKTADTEQATQLLKKRKP
jgi:hypothetical protein